MYGLEPAQVVPGNGSDELLAIVMRTFVDEGGTVAWFQPSYSLYPVLAAASRARVVEVPLPRDAAGLAVPRVQAGVFFLTSPNAPYGIAFPTAWIESLLEAVPRHRRGGRGVRGLRRRDRACRSSPGTRAS